MDTYNRSIIGLKSRSNGEYFERMIMAASRFYEDRGIAVIDKTPEAFKVIKPYNRDRGQFICCFTQQAQPDFKGALMDSTMVLFDAKHTDKGQISRNVVTEELEELRRKGFLPKTRSKRISGKPLTPYERTRAQVAATGNRWAMENFYATHS